MPNGVTPNLGLRLLIPSDVDNHLNVNRNLELLDIVSNLVLQSIDTTAEPTVPLPGQAWYVPAGATGSNWSGNVGKIGMYVENGTDADGWRFLEVFEGLRAFVIDGGIGTGARYSWDGAAWQSAGSSKPATFLHAGVPAAGATKYPMLFANSDLTFIEIHLSNHGGAGTVLPEIRFATTLSAAGTVLVSNDTSGTTGWANSANVKTTGANAVDADRLVIPAINWVWYEIPALTGGGCNQMTLHGIYQEG